MVHLCFQGEASYIAGERAGLLRAFRGTLPSQQALGSLFHAVQHLTKRMDQDGHDVHQVYLSLLPMHKWAQNCGFLGLSMRRSLCMLCGAIAILSI